MAYVAVEADDVRKSLFCLLELLTEISLQRLEEGPEGLEFKCRSTWCVHARQKYSDRCRLDSFSGSECCRGPYG